MVTVLRRLLSALHRDTRAAMSVEKILILLMIALPILIGLLAFRHYVQNWFTTQQSALEGQQ